MKQKKKNASDGHDDDTGIPAFSDPPRQTEHLDPTLEDPAFLDPSGNPFSDSDSDDNDSDNEQNQPPANEGDTPQNEGDPPKDKEDKSGSCLLYTSPSPRDS